jgi:hypothetical protein
VHDKFTNEELYLWMQGEISRLYYEYYGAIGFGRPFDPLGGQPDSGQLGEQAGGAGERHHRLWKPEPSPRRSCGSCGEASMECVAS